MELNRNWSDLPQEMLEEMAKTIPVIEDFMAFRGVCAPWRAAATKDKFVSRKRTTSYRVPPLLMLAEKPDTDDREFYSLRKKKISMRLPLPEAKGRRCMDAGFGWLLTASRSGEVNLLYPLTGSQIQLPSLRSFPFPNYDFNIEVEHLISDLNFITRVALSANPFHTSDFVVTVIYHYDDFLGFWRPGNPTWTHIESSACPPHRFFWSVTYYNRMLYAIGIHGDVFVWDGASFDLVLTINREYFDLSEAYLVESSRGELLVVTRDGVQPEDDGSYGATYFEVIRLDVEKRAWEEITSLEGDAIFVGHSTPISILASDFLDVIKPNCIYFTDDCYQTYTTLGKTGGGPLGIGGPNDMGVYNFEDDSISRFKDVESLSFICPPIWISF